MLKFAPRLAASAAEPPDAIRPNSGAIRRQTADSPGIERLWMALSEGHYDIFSS
jgi:hypothetical protein